MEPRSLERGNRGGSWLRLCLGVYASMEPRSLERGNFHCSYWEPHLRLRVSNAETHLNLTQYVIWSNASMEPRSLERGNSVHGAKSKTIARLASMEPRSLERGNDALF